MEGEFLRSPSDVVWTTGYSMKCMTCISRQHSGHCKRELAWTLSSRTAVAVPPVLV